MEMREAFTQTLIRLAEKDDRICLLDADLQVGHGTKLFKERFPERAFNLGVAEANMVSIAAGLSAGGKIPVAETFGCFAARRAYDQFFISANYARQNVKLVGSDPGVTAAFNGGTHMAFEDIAMMRAVPDLVISSPCDPASLEVLLEQLIYHRGSVYIRIPRKAEQKVYESVEGLELGKGSVLREGGDAVIIASGFIMVPEALNAADILAEEGIDTAVIDMHTIKPLDEEMTLQYAAKTGAVITAENAQRAGGLGGAVAELLSEKLPTPVLRIGVGDRFGQVGTLDYLMRDYGLTACQIVGQIKEFLSMRKESFSAARAVKQDV